jgi:single-stranded-DNA-specific exonuclease
LDVASRLDNDNAHRRQVEEQVLAQAMAQAESMPDAPGLVLYGPEWHIGVVGIVASRIVERFARPAIVIGQGGKGSARSVPSINVHEAIGACKEHLIKFGGHPAAAGLTLKPGAMPAFTEAFGAAVVAQASTWRPELHIDSLIAGEAIDLRLVHDLARIGPYGIGHTEPLLMLQGARITGRRTVGTNHLKLGIGGGLTAIGFRMADHASANSDLLDLAFVPVVSEWQGRERVELQLKGLRESAPI